MQGVGAGITSIDMMVKYLEPFVKGYRLVTVGNSAGGYLAMILGILLHAAFVISISGQVDITLYASDGDAYPELCRSKENPEKSKYFNILDMLQRSEVPIFYLYAARCGQDKDQFRMVEGFQCVYPVAFDSFQHGVAALPFNYPLLMCYTLQQWQELYGRCKGKIVKPSRVAKWTMECHDFHRMYDEYLVKHFWIDTKKRLKFRIKQLFCYLGIIKKR